MTNAKLLLADDSVTIRKVVELTFADEGVEVSTATDAETAMLKFVEIQPDIVLVDVGLEGTSGYQICEMIKNDEATRHIPVLLLVGSFEPFDQDEAERVGADGFLTKPFHSIRDLVGRVADLLGRQTNSHPLPPGTEDALEPALTSDIDHLYESSFADTAEIDEFDTVEDLLGDAGMDDEMIEATYPTGVFTESVSTFVSSGDDAAQDEALPESTSTLESAEAQVEQTKEFDWSLESIVAESTPAQTTDAPFEPKSAFDESRELETDVNETAKTDKTTAIEPKTPDDNDFKEPSPEFIALVAERVVEKLSDRLIREIAQDAVPRIAEKLIREALEEDKKG